VTGRLTAVALLLAALAVTVPAGADAAEPWAPDVAAAKAFVSHRRGDITWSVRTPTRSWGSRAGYQMHSASVVKAMLMVAYLDLPSVRGRALRPGDERLLSPMIRRSDNGAATAVRNIVGNGRLRGLARRAHMLRFATSRRWGYTRITAGDQTRLFVRIDQFVPARHRAYAMRLLRSIVPSQRWGVAKVRPRGWTLYFKGGWGAGRGLVDHQVALLRKGSHRVAIAVLTRFSGSQAYGNATLQGVFARLTRGLEDVP
jgi:hypothetical protein